MQTNKQQLLQVTKLETQLKTVTDPKLKAEIAKKLETIKAGKPVTK